MRVDHAIAAEMGLRFFRWLHSDIPIKAGVLREGDLSRGITRERVGGLFRIYYAGENNNSNNNSLRSLPKGSRNLEGLIMASLRIQKLMKSKRYSNNYNNDPNYNNNNNNNRNESTGLVICIFCQSDGKTFAPIAERESAREKLHQQRKELRRNKEGVIVSEDPHLEYDHPSYNNNYSVTSGGTKSNTIVPIHEDVTLSFAVSCDSFEKRLVTLNDIKPSGTHAHHFSIATPTPISLEEVFECSVTTTKFKATRIAVYRVTFAFEFLVVNNNDDGFDGVSCDTFVIVRDVLLRSGDPELYGVLEPNTPYSKKKRRNKTEKRIDPKNIVPPPKQEARRSGGGYKGLGYFDIPKHTQRMVETAELEDCLVTPWDEEDLLEDLFDFGITYACFWQNLLWASELQAYEDIRLFDMEYVALEPKGRLFKLYVSGLAEGRPSVLRGDLVLCQWKSKEYKGRVVLVEQLDVLLEFHPSFHKSFKANLDRLDRVRFTFPRTTFRTAHAGILEAPLAMKRAMLLPSKADVDNTIAITRDCPSRLKWTSALLNEEQKQAVKEIIKGEFRPLPYIIFGPPGTGKTTTLVEAIYQLANLQNKILVVAPSNDATDILVEKLSQYFPPSEMVRVLAYTRSIDQVPETVRRYCTNGMEAQQVISKILGARITVATINMASRLWCTGDNGLPRGHFDVLCVDEAGHATEPEVIAVASTVMDFYNNNDDRKGKSQLVLAGDPMQLGPIVTSELCKKFRMDRSYMERLIQTSPAYSLEHNSNAYPPHLVTLLVNNYRSHHQILKLPNEMFYRNQLIARGDVFQTHSMSKWEHLPTQGFPILFHAVDGENTREGSSPSWFNPQEAMVVVEYVQKLVQESKPRISPDDIGIITPYARQVQKIRLALKVFNIQDVKVGSVETFQGQERRVIIISTVRSENSLLQHDLRYNLGFVANQKRFNVAVTRAKALLIVVGNPRVLETDAKNWLPLLRFCKSKNSWLGEDWDETASSSERDQCDNKDSDGGKVDKDEWAAAAQEAYSFVNREE